MRALLVEDSEDDALLLVREMQKGGFEPTWERVETAAALRAALQRQWDVITCDCVMPQFSGPDALALLRELGCRVPIIVVSGEVDEEVAVAMMRAGAQDFVSKHRLTRLVPAIRREVRESMERWARTQAAAALEANVRQSVERLRTYIEQASDLIFTLDASGRIASVNRAVCALLGYSTPELLGRSPIEFVAPDWQAAARLSLKRLLDGESLQVVEIEVQARDGTRIALEVRGRSLRDGNRIVETFHIARNITERKRAEEERARLSAAVEQATEAIVMMDAQGSIVYANPATERMTGYRRAELYERGREIVQLHWWDQTAIRRMEAALTQGQVWHELVTHRHKDGHSYEVDTMICPVFDATGQLRNIVGLARDVTRSKAPGIAS